jgi:NAD(P)H dehydrogenase (quinone)
MKTLIVIVIAHPNVSGHCRQILHELKKQLTYYQIIDLYKMNYDPVLHEKEHYTSGNRNISRETAFFQKKIKEANSIVFVYPVWWNGVPAILKGFFDKVLTPGFGYRFEKSKHIKLLKRKKAAVIVTYASPNLYTTFILRDSGVKIVVNDILGFCGIKAKFFKIGDAEQLNEKQKMKIQKTVSKALKFLA